MRLEITLKDVDRNRTIRVIKVFDLDMSKDTSQASIIDCTIDALEKELCNYRNKAIKTMVHVFTWDGLEYDRETDEEEINAYRDTPLMSETENGLVFDFR